MEEYLNIEYFPQQDRIMYCGAACAEMALYFLGLPAASLDQPTLLNEIQNINPSESIHWYSAPDELSEELNDRLEHITYDLLSSDVSAGQYGEILTRRIIWSIHVGCPPIALVNQGGHWVIVKGYDVSAIPLAPDDPNYAINAIWVLDPLATWECFGDDPYIKWCLYLPERHIPYYKNSSDSGWTGFEWFSLCNIDGTWMNSHVAICWSLRDVGIPPPDRKLPDYTPIPNSRSFSGEQIISEKMAAEFAVKAFEKYGLYEKEFLKQRLNGVQPGEPVLVKTINRINQYYYIVPMQASNKNIYALASIDARFGTYRESGFAQSLERPVNFRKLSNDEILEILGKKFELKKECRDLNIYPEAVSIYPILVWKSCEQSRSPFLPFHLVTIGQFSLYVRIDGKIFEELTPPRGGG